MRFGCVLRSSTGASLIYTKDLLKRKHHNCNNKKKTAKPYTNRGSAEGNRCSNQRIIREPFESKGLRARASAVDEERIRI